MYCSCSQYIFSSDIGRHELLCFLSPLPCTHYGDDIMGTVASQITSLTIVYSTVWSDADQRKHKGFALLAFVRGKHTLHYNNVIMIAMASKIIGLTIVYSTVYSRTHQRKLQRSASLAFVRGSHRWPVNSPHKWPVTRKMFPFDDVIMFSSLLPRVRGFWSWFGGVCSLTYCNGNFRVTMVSEPFNVIL